MKPSTVVPRCEADIVLIDEQRSHGSNLHQSQISTNARVMACLHVKAAEDNEGVARFYGLARETSAEFKRVKGEKRKVWRARLSGCGLGSALVQVEGESAKRE